MTTIDNQTVANSEPQITETEPIDTSVITNALPQPEQLDIPQIPEIPQEKEAGIVSSITKAIAKIVGKETATDATPQLSAWANKEILQTKPVKKERQIGELVKKKTPKETPQQKLDTFQKNIIDTKYGGDVLKMSKEDKNIYNLLTKQVNEIAPMTAKIETEQRQMDASRIFDSLENGNSPKFNTFNPEKEAVNLLESDIDQFYKEANYHINFDTIKDDDDVRRVMGYMAENNKKVIDFERRGIVTDNELNKFADELNADPSFVKDFLSREAGGAIPTAEYVLAARQMLDASATKLKDLADKVTKNYSPQDKIDFAKQFDFHRKFQAKFMGVRAEYGRGLRAFGLPADSSEKEIQNILSAMEKDIDISSVAKMITNAESTKGINKITSGYESMWKYGADMLYTNYMASMLSGLSTQVVNIGGSVSNMLVQTAERKVASWFPKRWGNELDEVYADEMSALMIGYTSSFADAFKAGLKTLKTGEAYKGIGSFGQDYSVTLPSEQFKLGGFGGQLLDGAYKVLTFPIRNVMGSSDAFFKVINERGNLAAFAYRDARDKVKLGVIPPEEFPNYLKQTLENPSDELLAKAENQAKEIVYQEKTGEMIQAISKGVNQIPGGRYIVPFINTMANITRQTLGERTPAAFLRKKFYEDVTAGGSRAQLAMTKMSMGTGILGLGFMLAENGALTPPMPDDKATRDMWKAAGIKPLSFKIQDENGQNVYISHQGVEPFSTFFGIMASISEYNKKAQYTDMMTGEEKKYNSLMGDLLYATSENILNKTFATGLQTFLEAASGTYGVGGAQKLIQSYFNTMIPYSGLRRNITKELDEVKRNTSGTLEYIQSQIPVLSKNLPPIRDIFGEEVKHDYTWLRWTPNYETKDSVRLELQRLNEATQRMPVGDVRDIIGKELVKPEDREKWVTYARKDYTDSQGRNLHAVLKDIIHSEGYKNLLEIEKADLISTTVKQWDMAAFQTLSKDDPALFMRINNTEIGKRAMYLNEKEGMTKEDALQQAKDEFEQMRGE